MTVELATGATAADLVEAVGAHIDHVLVVRGSTPIAEDTPLAEGEELMLLSSFSGG